MANRPTSTRSTDNVYGSLGVNQKRFQAWPNPSVSLSKYPDIKNHRQFLDGVSAPRGPGTVMIRYWPRSSAPCGYCFAGVAAGAVSLLDDSILSSCTWP